MFDCVNAYHRVGGHPVAFRWIYFDFWQSWLFLKKNIFLFFPFCFEYFGPDGPPTLCFERSSDVCFTSSFLSTQPQACDWFGEHLGCGFGLPVNLSAAVPNSTAESAKRKLRIWATFQILQNCKRLHDKHSLPILHCLCNS